MTTAAAPAGTAPTGSAPTDAAPARAGHWWIPALAGSLLALGVFAWYVTIGRRALMVFDPYGNFYDAQANALRAGHWNVGARELFLEGFRLHGRTYTYFGVWPSLLRMPILAIWPSAYGKLTRLSMLLAFAVYLTGLSALHARVRSVWRGDRPWSRAERVLAFAVPLVGGLGTTALFLGSSAWVYHEAILWGAAWAIVAFERLLAFLLRPSGLRLAGASAAGTLAFASRASVGTGVAIALGLVAGGFVLRAVAPSLPRLARPLSALDWLAGLPAPGRGSDTDPGPDRGPGPDAATRAARRWILPAVVATLVPVVTYCYVNASRFGSLYSVPWDRQVVALTDPATAATLRANDGTYFGLKYAPTTLLQFLRPDALGVDALFPWFSFQRFRTPLLGDVRINSLDFTSSVTASMPALLLLTLLACIVVWTRRARDDRALTTLRVPLISAAIGVVFVVTIAFVAQRYEGDWLPFLAIGGLAGLYTLLDARARARTATGRRLLTAALAALAVLGAFQIWVNGSLALLYQRLYNPHEPTLRAGMLGTQYDVDGVLGGGRRDTTFPARLPRPATAGTSAVLGDCDALYWSDGRAWHLVQGTPAGGVFDLRGGMPPADGVRHPLLAWTRPDGTDAITVRRTDPRHYRVERVHVTPDGAVQPAADSGRRRVAGHGPFDFEVRSLAPVRSVGVRVDRNGAIGQEGVTDLPTGAPTVGTTTAAGIAPTYGAPLRLRAPDVGVCRRILDARGS